jgi:hypothetical protein
MSRFPARLMGLAVCGCACREKKTMVALTHTFYHRSVPLILFRKGGVKFGIVKTKIKNGLCVVAIGRKKYPSRHNYCLLN